MSITALKKKLVPPVVPLEVPTQGDIAAFEEKYTKLPTDFVDFLYAYGTGVIDNFIWVFNPASKNPNLNLLRQAKLQIDTFRRIYATEKDLFQFPLFPEKGGLLPFGITDNGDVLFWKTENDPQQWSVVISDSRAPKYEEYALNLTGFLLRLLIKELRSDIFPEEVPSELPTFMSIV